MTNDENSKAGLLIALLGLGALGAYLIYRNRQPEQEPGISGPTQLVMFTTNSTIDSISIDGELQDASFLRIGEHKDFELSLGNHTFEAIWDAQGGETVGVRGAFNLSEDGRKIIQLPLQSLRGRSDITFAAYGNLLGAGPLCAGDPQISIMYLIDRIVQIANPINLNCGSKIKYLVNYNDPVLQPRNKDFEFRYGN